MSGAEFIGAAAATIQLISLASSALDLYREARQSASNSHDGLRFRLEVEAATYGRWCSSLGIERILRVAAANPKSWTTGPEFIEFKDSIQIDLNMNHHLMSSLILSILKDLNRKFEEARERLPNSPTSRRMQIPFKRRKPVASWSSEDGVEKCTGFLRATRWILWDKKRFMTLLEELASINDSLVRLLGREQQVHIKRSANLQALSSSGSGCKDCFHEPPRSQTEGSVNMGIGNLARLRDMNLREDLSNDISQESPTANTSVRLGERVPNYQVEDFDSTAMRNGISRIQCSLDENQVVIEWKYYSKTRPFRFQQILRLGSLALLLGRSGIHQGVHIPSCKGLVHDNNNNRVGIVYDVPRIERGENPLCKDLQTLIKDSQSDPPPLGQRFLVAKQLSMVVHYLQSVHWLHKSLRSDNIVYFQKPLVQIEHHRLEPSLTDNGLSYTCERKTHLEDFRGSNGQLVNQARQEQSQTPEQITLSTQILPPFYVVGLDLSRPDHPSELSESFSISTEGYRSQKENIDLYSHPRSLLKDASGKQQRFRPEYDIYSFGLIQRLDFGGHCDLLKRM